MLYYKTNFPRLTRRLTDEASTGYLSNPEVPALMKAAIPNAKIIAILRNLVDRAYSHYHFARRQNAETSTTFEETMELEESRRKEYEEAISELKSIFCKRRSPDRDCPRYGVPVWHFSKKVAEELKTIHSWPRLAISTPKRLLIPGSRAAQ